MEEIRTQIVQSGKMRKRKLTVILKLNAPVLQRENSARCMDLLDPGAAGDLLAWLQHAGWARRKLTWAFQSQANTGSGHLHDFPVSLQKAMYSSTSHSPTLGTRSEFAATDVWGNLCYTTCICIAFFLCGQWRRALLFPTLSVSGLWNTTNICPFVQRICWCNLLKTDKYWD